MVLKHEIRADIAASGRAYVFPTCSIKRSLSAPAGLPYVLLRILQDAVGAAGGSHKGAPQSLSRRQSGMCSYRRQKGHCCRRGARLGNCRSRKWNKTSRQPQLQFFQFLGMMMDWRSRHVNCDLSGQTILRLQCPVWESPERAAAKSLSKKNIWGISISGFPVNPRYSLSTVNGKPKTLLLGAQFQFDEMRGTKMEVVRR